MNERMRYRLQRRETVARPNVLGNRSFPVYTYRWKDIAISDSKDELQKLIPPGSKGYRIEDTGSEAEEIEVEVEEV